MVGYWRSNAETARQHGNEKHAEECEREAVWWQEQANQR
jgi:hypothetical protein